MSNQGWIGVDLDGTLAEYDGFIDHFHIGPPIPKMLARVKQWLIDGEDVRIFTARVAYDDTGEIAEGIREWCKTHLLRELPVTCRKNYEMKILYDDRCCQVRPNTGITLEEEISELTRQLHQCREDLLEFDGYLT